MGGGGREPMCGEGPRVRCYRRATGLLWCLVAVVSVAGCGERGAPSSSGVVVDTLPGGAVQVVSPTGGTWGAEDGWVFEEDLRIGRAEGEGPDVFGSVRALEVDRLGRIYVLEPQAREVRVFDRDGAHLRTLGREGSGPGEFRNPVGLALAPDDDALWVIDPGNARYTVFDSAGALRASHTRPFAFFALPWPGGFDRDGRFHDIGTLGEALAFVRLADPEAPTDTPADTFRIPADEAPRLLVSRADGTPVASIVPPFASRLQWRFDPRGFVWTAEDGRFRFVQQTLTGDTVRIVSRGHEPVPVTAAEADSARRAVEEIVAANAGPGGRVDGELRVPDRKPALQAFFMDREGFLWVEPSRASGASRALEVFDPHGVFLGPVDVPLRLELRGTLPVVRGDALYGVITDELEVPRVVRMRREEGG